MHDYEEIQEFCKSIHPAVESDFPFDTGTLTMKIGGKIFCFIPLERHPPYIGIKAEPEKIIELKEHKEAAFDAPYLGKKHWSGIYLSSDVYGEEMKDLIKTSFDLVFAKLTKKVREGLSI